MAPTPKPKNTTQCQNLMLTALSIYYKKHKINRDTLYSVINGDSILSLRLIDWFVTHYARVNNIVYWIDETTGVTKIYEEFPKNADNNTSLRKFNLYLDYRAQLQSYTKMFFDPFRRYVRITFVLETEPLLSIESTVGQLNFFRWALQNGVLEYIKNNIKHIEDNMTVFQKQTKNTAGSLEGSVENKKITNAAMNASTTNTATNATDNVFALEKTKIKTKTKKNKTLQNIQKHTVTRVPCLIHFD
jgi:hypothetical protein